MVRLRRAFGARFTHPFVTPEQLGLGIVLEKLSELLILPHQGIHLDYDFEKDYDKVKSKKIRVFSDSIKTKICKVYWFKVEKFQWEYEDDLWIAENENTKMFNPKNL